MSENNGVKFNLSKKLIDVNSDGYEITDLIFSDGTTFNVSDSIVISTIPLNVIWFSWNTL